MKLAKKTSNMSPCCRSKWGAVIKLPTGGIVSGWNRSPISLAGRCGGRRCLRKNISSGTNLEISCIHAEMVALMHGGGIRDSTLYLYGQNGVSLPCAGCMKHLIYAGVTTMFISGLNDIPYECEPPIPKTWMNQITFTVIPDKVLT